MPSAPSKRKRDAGTVLSGDRKRQRSLSSENQSCIEDEDSSDDSPEVAGKATVKPTTFVDTRKKGHSARSGGEAEDRSKHHVRFGSEEPPAAVDAATLEEERRQQQQQSQREQGSESEDEAPEDVSVSAALQSARSAAAAATKAADNQRKATRQKRREQEEKLQAQADETRKAAAAKRAKADEKARREAQRERAKSKTAATEDAEPDSDSDAEPVLLPEELLTDNIERAPTPPPADQERRKRERKQHRRKKLLDQSPKDVKIGPVNVSVLQKANAFLPPKAAPGARDRREHWLAGRASGKGIRAFQRKPVNAGFV